MSSGATTIARACSLLLITMVAVGFPLTVGAQAGHSHHDTVPPPPVAAPPATKGGDVASASVDAAMSGGPLVVSPYMKLTPTRAATAADSVRAATVTSELRTAIAKYKDVKVAEADGYKMFAPKLRQEIYHFTNTWRSVKESFRFNPAEPSSLLYRRTRTGGFELVGAMYHAPKRLSPAKLDERVPLSIARWHAHTNFCVPPRRDQERWLETKGGKPVFGPMGGISTREQCDAVKGKFHDQVFGWMVHAMVFEGTELGKIWGADDHAGHGAGHH